MIVLLGHGYIGEHISKELTKQDLDYVWLSHKDKLPNKADAVINAAGYTGSPNVDACEIYKQETIDGNVIWPLKLEHHYPTTPIVHISSGCIYGGYDRPDGYTEDDKPNFDFNNGSFYSGSKALGQELLMPYLKHKSYLLRIRMPFGDEDHPKNFLTKMKKYQKLISYDNSLSYVPDVASTAVHFVLHTPKAGIYNVCNPGYSNAREIVDMMGIQKDWFTEDEFKTATKAPRSNCILNTSKLQSIYPLMDVRTALKKAIGNLSK